MQNIPRNRCTAVPVIGFLLMNALVSQKEPKLALSGHSGRLSSLLVLTQCPVTEKSSIIPFCYNFHSLGGAISFCFNPHSWVQPGQRTACLFSWPSPTPLRSSFLSAWSVCPHALPTCLSVCPIPHISTRVRALKDVSTFTVSKLSYLFYCFFVSAGEEFGTFHVVL